MDVIDREHNVIATVPARATRRAELWFWGTLTAGTLLLAWLLSAILLPFIAGLLFAVFLDPAVNRLARLGFTRAWAALVLTVLVFAVLIGLLMLVIPPLLDQAARLVESLPGMLQRALQFIQRVGGEFGRAVGAPPAVPPILPAPPAPAPDMNQQLHALAPLATQAVSGVLGGGLAVLELGFLLLLTPIVSFYLLRDWPALVAAVDACLPARHAPAIRAEAAEVRSILTGFVRGQTLICAILAAWYSLGLAAAGVEFALVIGVVSGVLSFIPYVGTTLFALAATGTVLVHDGPAPGMLLAVGGILLVSEIAQYTVLHPYLVGPHVGLHPVWLIFALLASGALFGAVGLFLAIPLFATLGVLFRFCVRCYRASRFFGSGPA